MSKNPEQMTDEEFEAYMNSAIAEGTDDIEANEEVEVEVDGLDDVEEDNEDEIEEDDDTDDGEDDTEQPESDADAEDSDDDETDDEEDEDETEQGLEEDETAIDSEEDNLADDSTKEPETEVTIPTYQIKANGTDFEFTADELVKLAPKALDYTRKMQQIKPWREMISALEEAKLSKDDINLLIEVSKGDKNATAELLKKTGVDTLDLDVEGSNYTPKNYGRNEKEIEIDDVIDVIAKDQEYTTTAYIVDKQWDEQSRQEFVKDPGKIAALHDDVKSGVYDKVAPIALKMKAIDGGKKSDLDYYVQAGGEYYKKLRAEETARIDTETRQKTEQEKVNKAKASTDRQTAIKKTAKKRKAAATTKPSGGKRKVIDYLDNDSLSDEEFSALMEKQIRKG